MKAFEYINRYVAEEARPYASVVVSYALKTTHLVLAPDTPVPDDDDRNVTVFIQIDTMSMPPVLIADHNCRFGWVCLDHPDQPEGHDGCYGNSTPCPYPTCAESGQPPQETPEAEVEVLGAGS